MDDELSTLRDDDIETTFEEDEGWASGDVEPDDLDTDADDADTDDTDI